MYSKILNSWSTTLCTYDSESCIVTWLLPCHTYAKLRLTSYGIHFLAYAFLVLGIRNILSTWSYIHMYKCPSHYTDQCITVQGKCSEYYTHINGIPTECIYVDEIDACIYNSQSCIHVHSSLYVFFSCMLSIFYVCLWMMNYSARKVIRDTYQLKEENECVASTILSPCGLSQGYREIV
jgi:hypothetical protein